LVSGAIAWCVPFGANAIGVEFMPPAAHPASSAAKLNRYNILQSPKETGGSFAKVINTSMRPGGVWGKDRTHQGIGQDTQRFLMP
jgi:hypothetical protein